METEVHASGDSAHRPRRVGAVLAEARVAAGLELSDIARDTRVPARHLTAIENDAHDSLPALPYAIGFVKSFARAVGLDPETVAGQFRAETSKTAHVPATAPMEPLDERRLPPRGLLTLSLIGVVVIVGAVIAYSAGVFDGPLPADPEIAAAPPAAVQTAPVPTQAVPAATATVAPELLPAAPAATGTTAAPVASGSPPAPVGPSRVVITAGEDAWFRVSGFDPAVGRVVTVKTGVLAKGERYAVPGVPGMKLWTGRAGALRLSVDGRPLPPLGGPVTTVKNVSLDAADLLAGLATPPAAPAPAGNSQ